MKDRKEIPRQASTPKRGASFIWDGKEVYLYHVRNPQCYVMSTDKLFASADDMREFHPSELTPVRKTDTSIKSKSKQLTPQEVSDQKDLNAFYDEMAKNMPDDCMECGKPLYASTKWFKRGCCAHILPKSQFPTIATDPDNIMWLGFDLIGVCNCHGEYDGLGAVNRANMNIYQFAQNQYHNKLKPQLSGHEQNLAEKYLHINP